MRGQGTGDREQGRSGAPSLLRPLCSLVLCALLVACAGDPVRPDQASEVPPLPLPTLMATPTGMPPTPPPAQPADRPVDTGWQAAAPGVELRELRVSVAGEEAPVSVVRLDPALVRLEVRYAPDAPLALAAWAGQAGAVAAINGGFFDEAGRTVALLVHAGQSVGESYVGRGGMFAVTPQGGVWLRGLADAPYSPDEPVAEAIQGWPMLVKGAGVAAYDSEDNERARRSAIALDAEGRVLLIAASSAAFTLPELAAWLAASDLGISAAMNLDGGSSTGLLVQSEAAPARIEPFVPLPIVLLALPR